MSRCSHSLEKCYQRFVYSLSFGFSSTNLKQTIFFMKIQITECNLTLKVRKTNCNYSVIIW